MKKLPGVTLPPAFAERAVRAALAPEVGPVLPAWTVDVALVAFCAGHLGWCLHAVGLV